MRRYAPIPSRRVVELGDRHRALRPDTNRTSCRRGLARVPRYRGPRRRRKATPPLQWSVPESKLVKWRVPVAGLGHSSPVVWGDQVCTASAISGTPDPQLKVGLYGDIGSVLDTTAHKWIVLCFDKQTGKLRWERTAKSGVPIIKRHPKSTHASSTLATDGRHIVAMFGSEGLYAYDMNGELLWKKDFGTLDSGFFMVPDAQWGFASSPIIHNGRVIMQADVQKGSFVAAFDVRTGKELWRTPRADVPTWSTPAVVAMNGRDQVIVNGWKHIGGYDLETGKEVWRMTGGGDIPVPTPITAHGLVFITNAHGKMAPIYAIKPTATGDISLKEGETSNAAHRVELHARRRLHADADRLRRHPVRVPRQRRAERVRREDRHAPLPGAARRRARPDSPRRRSRPAGGCISRAKMATCTW